MVILGDYVGNQNYDLEIVAISTLLEIGGFRLMSNFCAD